MSQFNPYQPPQSSLKPPVSTFAMPQAQNTGVWRDGNKLVMHKDAQLPDICVKTNQPAQGNRLRRKLSWHEPWIGLTILIAWPVYLILAMILTKRATIYIGLTPERMARRRIAIIVGWSLALAGLASFVGAVAITSGNGPARDQGAWLFLVGIVLLIAGAIFGIYASRVVWPKKITDQFVWLGGVHRDYLNNLPPWPNYPG